MNFFFCQKKLTLLCSFISGWKRAVFNLSCFFLLSWPLRIIYPCYFGITMDQYDDFDDPDSVVVDNQSYTSGLPSYSEVQIEQPPPPSYEETISRIKRQLPILSRSISLSGQKMGRKISIRRGTIESIEDVAVVPMSLDSAIQNPSVKIPPTPDPNNPKKFNQSFSMVEDRRVRHESMPPVYH